MPAIIADTGVDAAKVEPVLHGAGLDERALRDGAVVGDQAVGEAEAEFGGWVERRGAEEDQVAQAFGGPVRAGYRVGGGVDPERMGEGGGRCQYGYPVVGRRI